MEGAAAVLRKASRTAVSNRSKSPGSWVSKSLPMYVSTKNRFSVCNDLQKKIGVIRLCDVTKIIRWSSDLCRWTRKMWSVLRPWRYNCRALMSDCFVVEISSIFVTIPLNLRCAPAVNAIYKVYRFGFYYTTLFRHHGSRSRICYKFIIISIELLIITLVESYIHH